LPRGKIDTNGLVDEQLRGNREEIFVFFKASFTPRIDFEISFNLAQCASHLLIARLGPGYRLARYLESRNLLMAVFLALWLSNQDKT
jgi:hypothetical protein